MTKARINKAVTHLQMEVVGKRGDGYFYFLDTVTGYQVGPSVGVCYLNHGSLEFWIRHAEYCRNKQNEEDILWT
jgi:hypothetical protein